MNDRRPASETVRRVSIVSAHVDRRTSARDLD